MNSDIEILSGIASGFGRDVKNLSMKLIGKPEFELWSGSSRPFQHHYGKGGLAKHTLEVANLCMTIRRQFYFYYAKFEIDEVELFLAALFHDAGKIYDYKPLDTEYKEWEGTDHKRMIHHISRSSVMWTQAVTPFSELSEKYHDKVLHAILSHHGNREAGSPVAPKSRVAWLVHLCDGISARMYDADTLDIVKRDKI